MLVQVIKDGPQNLTILVKGIVKEDFGPTLVLDLEKIAPPSEGWKGLRFDSAVWLIQEKMVMRLWWGEEQTEENLAMLMESRNSVRLDVGIPSPRVRDKDKWPGKMYLSAIRKMDEPKAFLIILDFDKQ